MISQWAYYITEGCPAVTGRSSLVDEKGELDLQMVCPDPAYKLTLQEWVTMLEKGSGLYYRWYGPDLLAELEITQQGVDELGRPSYSVFLEFAMKSVKEKLLAEREAEDIRRGEAEGWGTAAEYQKNRARVRELNRILEANALRRGDSLVARELQDQPWQPRR